MGVALLLAACGGAGGSPAASASNSNVQVFRAEPEAPPVQAAPAQPVPPPTGTPAPAINPFQGAEFYVNPEYAKKVDSAIAKNGQVVAGLARLKGQPTALWLDTIAATARIPEQLKDAARQSEAKGKPVVPVFVVYDLPNRDCAAKASAGELSIEAQGEARYRTEFIDTIARHFASMPNQRIVAILEPDSLPNLVTNLEVEKCAVSAQVYKHSVAYAIAKLSLPNVFVYLDAAHAGWLGWDNNRNGMAEVFKEVLQLAGGADRIRGFATNVANYNALQGEFGLKLEPTTPTPNELMYVQKLAESLAQQGITNKTFLIDTSRNGQAEIRTKWGSWCNVRGAGLGERPTVAPAPLVDAYFWVKPPGESDGTADPKAARFDENCASADATPGAPEAGQWFESYFLELVRRAQPAL